MFRSIFLMAIGIAVASLVASSFLAQYGAQPRFVQAVLDVMLHRASPARYQPSSSRSTEDRPAVSGSGQIAIAPDRSGNYLTEVEIDGRFIHMVVDTGATYVSLTNADAAALGLRPAPADYIYRTMTANGTGVAAKVRIDRLRIGSMEIYNVEAFVMPPGVLGTSLLGMSALRRLRSFEISGGQLVLRW
jgi:aspartyl protease family protein